MVRKITSNPYMTSKYVLVGRFNLLSTGALRQFEIIHLTEKKIERLTEQSMFWELLQKEAKDSGIDIEDIFNIISAVSVSAEDNIKYAPLILAFGKYNLQCQNDDRDYGNYLAAYLLSTRLDRKHIPLIIEAYEEQGITQLETVEDYMELIKLLGVDEYSLLLDFFVAEEHKGEEAITSRDKLKK